MGTTALCVCGGLNTDDTTGVFAREGRIGVPGAESLPLPALGTASLVEAGGRYAPRLTSSPTMSVNPAACASYNAVLPDRSVSSRPTPHPCRYHTQAS